MLHGGEQPVGAGGIDPRRQRLGGLRRKAIIFASPAIWTSLEASLVETPERINGDSQTHRNCFGVFWPSGCRPHHAMSSVLFGPAMTATNQRAVTAFERRFIDVRDGSRQLKHAIDAAVRASRRFWSWESSRAAEPS
jgi:hypothetical protein